MDINKILDAGGYVHENPEYNPKTKKGQLQPQYIVNADPNGAINQGSALAGVMSQPGRQGINLDYLGTPEKYSEYDVTISPVDVSLEKELANEQGALHKFGNAIAQAAVSEVAIGTVKGISDLVDFVSGAVFRSDNDYSNPVSQYLAQLQEDFKAYAPIYSDPDKNIFNGGLADAGWWASNLPSVMSSLTLMIPSTGITKGLSWAGKALNTASKGKLAAYGRNAYKVMTGASKAKTVEDAAKLNSVTRWLNDTNTMAAGQRMLETGVNAALMRTMENYQEARQVYSDMQTKTLEKFNSMSDAEYADFVNKNANILEGVDVNDKEAVSNKIAKDAADRTFLMDYANTVFDVIQLNALRNPIKLLKNMRASGAINEAQRKSMSAIGKAAVAGTETAAEKAGLATTAKNFGRGVGQFLKDSKHVVMAEASEGVEEAINYIAQEEGMHYGNVALGEDINNGFTSRLGSYLRSPELYDAAFWGVLGGVVFQGLGSGFNRLSVAAERYNQQKKKKADDTTGEATNTANFQELFETSENKRRIADIEARTKDFNDLVTRLDQIETQGIDPFNVDENNNPISLETETEKTIAKERAISEYITGMTFRAMDNGNFDMLKAYLKDANIRQALEEATGNEGDGGAFIDSCIRRIDEIADKYSQNLIALSNIARNVNIASESAIPLEYLQIIARDNTAAQMKLQDLNTRISTYETSAENKKAVYGDKLDQSLNYKDAVNLVVLTQQLATLMAKRAELINDKSKQGIGRQIEIDDIEKKIDIVENMIAGQGTLSNSDALTRLLYSTIQSNLINDKDTYVSNIEALARGDIKAIIGKKSAKKFKLTDEEIMKVLGEDKTSGAYRTLATDIDSVFEGQYGLNKIDKRLGDDYVALAGLNIEKAVLNESLVINEDSLQKKVNELHNDMLDARKKAIDDSRKTLLELAKKYGRDNVATNLETGQEIVWENDADKKAYDDALAVLNLTSASNRRLYKDMQFAIMMDGFIEASQNASNTEGESSSTSQNQNAAAQNQSSNNQSNQSSQTTTGQGNTLNNAQSSQSQQQQGQSQTPNVSNEETLTNIENTDAASMSYDDLNNNIREAVRIEMEARNAGDNNLVNRANATFKKLQLERYNRDLANATVPEGAHKLVNTTNHYINFGVVSMSWNGAGYYGYNKNGQRIESGSMSADEFERLTGVNPTTISSTGGQQSSSTSPKTDGEGNAIVDSGKDELLANVSNFFRESLKQAKADGNLNEESINKTAQEALAKFGNTDDAKSVINRMIASYTKIGKRQGWVSDVANVVSLASSVVEQGGKYIFPEDFVKATKHFIDKYLDAVNSKEYNGKRVVSFESMLRFANEQMEDNTTADYIYKALKAWFQNGPDANKYIILDNMDSTSILQRAAMTNKELAQQRLGGTNVFRVDIYSALNHMPSKQAIDALQVGDTLTAEFNNAGDIILLSNGVEVGRLPQPQGDGAGGFKKTNNGWITDVKLNNGAVVSNLRKIWEDILLNKSTINDKINSYIYQIIAANKINADTKSIKDAIEKDSDLKAYFDGLKQQGVIDKNADSVQLIDGLVSIWNYIDLTNPVQSEREADIQYSLDLWFNKLYDTYSTIANGTTVGLDKLNFKVAKVTDGDVIQVAANDNESYNKCTLGNGNEAFANIDITEVGVIKPGSAGVIQTTANHQVPQPNGSTGSMWAVFPNRSGIPGIVRGHTLKFMDTGSNVNNTPAGRIRKAVENEFERRIRNWASDINNENAYKELAQFIDLVFGNNTSTPIFAPVYGGQNGKFRVDNTRADRIVISYVDSAGNWSNFTINFLNMQYNNEKLGYKDADNVESFIRDFRDNILASSMFNADFRFFDSDSGAAIINGLATRRYDPDGIVKDFIITIPNGTDTPLVESFPSFKHFLMEGGGARWNTKNQNGSNFEPRSKTNQLRNQILNVSIESATSLPVEGNVDNQITTESIINNTAIDTLLKKKFGKNSPAVKRLKKAGLIPSSVTYTTSTLDKGGHPSNIWTSLGKKTIYVNDEFIKMMNDNPDMAIRKLIHEQLHLKLHSKGNQRKELLNRISEIITDFRDALDNDTNTDPHLREYLFEHIENNEERLEEFLVESLTNRELASYLNSVQTEIPGTKTKKSLLNKILDLLAEIFDWGVTKGSLYEKELRVLQGFSNEEIESSVETNTQTETLKTLNDYIDDSKKHITFDDDTHTYYVDGEPVDYSVTQYAGEIYGKPNIEGDYSHSSAIGRSMDAMYRDFFIYGDDVVNRNYPNLNVARKKQILEDLHRLRSYFDNRFGKGSYVVVTNEFPLAVTAKTENGDKTIAGTMDMLIIDKDGNFHIFDFKAKNHPIDRKINGKEGDDRRNYSAQQNMYREMLESINPDFEGKVKSIQLIWMDTFYPGIREVNYFTDENGQVTVDGTPIESYTGFGTPHLKENVEDSIIPLEISDKVEELEVPEMESIIKIGNIEETEEDVTDDEDVEDEFEDDDNLATSVKEDTAPSVNQFVESLPLEERVNFDKLLLDGTVSMKCS